MERLVKLIDKLNDLLDKTSIKTEINLPEIIVIGDQSCGKSSLLQSIIMKDILPRGTGTVTKCPIRVCIRKASGSNELAAFAHDINKKLDLDLLSKRLKEENEKRSASLGISLEDLTVYIYSPNLISLTLVDLPGIIQNVNDGESTRLRDDIESLITSRIKNPNSIILAVCNSAIDLNNSVALRKAREVDPGLNRTMLVFTKMDLCQDPDSVINPKIKTGLGHIGVRCRTEEEIKRGVKIEKQINDEENFFNGNSVYRSNSELFGVKNLIRKIVDEFSKHVERKLPEIQSQIEDIIERLQNEYESLPEYQSVPNQLSFAQSRLFEYFRRIEGILEGRVIRLTKESVINATSIRSSFESLDENLSDLEIAVTESSNTQELYKMSRGLEGVSSISITLVKEQMEKIIKKAEKHCFDLLVQTRFSIETIFLDAYNDLFREFKEFKRFIDNSIDRAIDLCFDKTKENIKGILLLEYTTVECEESMIDSEEQLMSLIMKLWKGSRKSLARIIPKCIKYHFIQQVISLSKNNILESMNNLFSKNELNVFPEIDRMITKKSSILQNLEKFKDSKKRIDRFYGDL